MVNEHGQHICFGFFWLNLTSLLIDRQSNSDRYSFFAQGRGGRVVKASATRARGRGFDPGSGRCSHFRTWFPFGAHHHSASLTLTLHDRKTVDGP